MAPSLALELQEKGAGFYHSPGIGSVVSEQAAKLGAAAAAKLLREACQAGEVLARALVGSVLRGPESVHVAGVAGASDRLRCCHWKPYTSVCRSDPDFLSIAVAGTNVRRVEWVLAGADNCTGCWQSFQLHDLGTRQESFVVGLVGFAADCEGGSSCAPGAAHSSTLAPRLGRVPSK